VDFNRTNADIDITAKDRHHRGMYNHLTHGIVFGIAVLLSLPTPVRSAEIRLAGDGATWCDLLLSTNSVQSASVLSEVDHSIVSTSEVDTCLSFLPTWGAWRDLPDATLDVWVEVVGDSSNAVAVLLGDPETPALTIVCESDWAVLPAGVMPPDEPVTLRLGVSTNRFHLVLRTGAAFGRGSCSVETQMPAGSSWTARPDLVLTGFGWLGAAQEMPLWSRVGVCMAGPQAALTELRMRWCVDGNVFIIASLNSMPKRGPE
jgi:hypothetical protein